MTSSKISSVVVAMMLLVIAVPVVAGTINLNDTYNGGNPFMSDNYMWIDVVETNGPPNDPAFNYYRDPSTVGNSFIVNPTNFRVDVTPGPGLQQIDSQLEMVIMGTSGATIPFLNFVSSGDFEVNGQNLNDSFVSSTVSYDYEILEGANVGMTGSGMEVFSAAAAPNSSGTGMLNLDIDFPNGATKIRVEFDNSVTAEATTDLSSAFIAKKVNQGIIITVPEPSAILLLLGCIGVVVLRRRY